MHALDLGQQGPNTMLRGASKAAPLSAVVVVAGVWSDASSSAELRHHGSTCAPRQQALLSANLVVQAVSQS